MTQNERVLALLADGEWHDHHQGYALNLVLHSRIAELRARGHVIESRRDTAPDGSQLYLYRLVSLGAEVRASEAPLRSASAPAGIRSSAPSEQLTLLPVPARREAWA